MEGSVSVPQFQDVAGAAMEEGFRELQDLDGDRGQRQGAVIFFWLDGGNVVGMVTVFDTGRARGPKVPGLVSTEASSSARDVEVDNLLKTVGDEGVVVTEVVSDVNMT